MKEKLKQAMDSVKVGDNDKARELLLDVLRQDPTNDVAWVWMSAVVETDELRQNCLEEALKYNPRNKTAKRALDRMVEQGRVWQERNREVNRSKKPTPRLGQIVTIVFASTLGLTCIAAAFVFLMPRTGISGNWSLFWVTVGGGVLLLVYALMITVGVVSLMKNPPSREELKAWQAQRREAVRRLRKQPSPWGGVLGAIGWELFTGMVDDTDEG
jgi:hypothetical protein